MATKAEQFHAEEQRLHRGKKHGKNASGSKPGSKPSVRSAKRKHAGKKATHAIEPTTAKGTRPSRKSTRKSANRAKPDATFNLQEEQRKGSPTARFRKSSARSSRVRGS